MSRQLIDRSPDLKRLRDEGYDIEVVNGYIIMRDVPYLNSNRQVLRGTLISNLILAGQVTSRPDTHVAFFAGEYPCHADGKPIERMRHGDNNTQVSPALRANFSFSAKPKPRENYDDYYEKMSVYAAILSGPAQEIDKTATPNTFPSIRDDATDSVFKYVDTASSRADITEISRKLVGHKIAIVGLGGTGSYVLDLVAKTSVQEIHLFDGDDFLQHNAFRAPGAASNQELEEKPKKVAYLERIYSKMRHGIVPHPTYASAESMSLLASMHFVFLCLEGKSKKEIVRQLEAHGRPFVDVGMGIYIANGSLGGVIRTTTSTPSYREHVWTRQRIPFSDATEANEYSKNIQIAELNALNAALAVIKWKKLFGFYVDQEIEHHSTYTIGGNDVDNEDKGS